MIAEESADASSTYCYDALGRLTSFSRNGQQYTYQYDAFNRRIKKIGPDFEECYLYIDQKEVGKIDTQGKITQLRILGHGKGAEIGAIALELEDTIYIPIHDHAGNFAVLIDLRTHTLAEGYVYTAFGEEQRYGIRTTNPWHFSSKRLDPESGWIYFGRRYYDPPTGRWTTPDPIGFADGPNLYAYVKNNPLTHFDAYGLLGAGTGGSSLYDANRRERDFRDMRNSLRETRSRETNSSSLMSRILDAGSRLLSNPRFQGGLQALGGLLEAGAGTTLALGSSGLSTAAGCGIMAHGLDHYITGMNALFSGTPQETMTAQGLQQAGVPPNAAHFIDETVVITATMGAGTLVKGSRIASTGHAIDGNLGLSGRVTQISSKSDIGWPYATDKPTQIWMSSKQSPIDCVISETMSGRGNITSRYQLSAPDALMAGEKFLRLGYKEIGKAGSGVFRSADGLRQFRIDSGSITGQHSPWMPHIHLEVLKPNSNEIYINNHVIFYE